MSDKTTFKEKTILRSSHLVLFSDIPKQSTFLLELSPVGYVPNTHRIVHWDSKTFPPHEGILPYRSVTLFDNTHLGRCSVVGRNDKVYAEINFGLVPYSFFRARKKLQQYPGIFFNPLVDMVTVIETKENMNNHVISTVTDVLQLFITTQPLQL